MSMDLFVARTMITKASLIFRGLVHITESQVIRFCKLRVSAVVTSFNISIFYFLFFTFAVGFPEKFSC